jgi:hypothetical protein
VSLQDYEDFARAFAGVGKALATWAWLGRSRGVFVTVSGVDGALLPPESRTYINLLAAMRRSGDPDVALRVQSYDPAFFRFSAGLILDPAAPVEAVRAHVEAALRASFSFAARGFGQSVALSEVLAVAHSAPGVRAVQVHEFFRTDGEPGIAEILPAAAPSVGAEGAPLAAELLTLDPRPLSLTETLA